MSKLAKFFNQPVEEITIEQFKDFLHHRINVDRVSVPMINQAISAFKIIQKDVLGRDWESIKVKRPRREKKLPVVLSVEEIAAIINVTENLKHKALIALAYSSGMRKSEVKLLKPAHIDSKRMRIHVVHGKGKKARYTILSAKALDLLRTYFRIERPSVYLFEPNGNKGNTLAESTLNTIVKKLAKKAEIKKEISFHTLRHSFATHLLEKGVNLRIIQQFMGHNSIKTTSVYLHIANIDPNQVASPLDEMNI
jgi:site-specific recombinase XerD